MRACAVEMHMDTSQKPFCLEIYRENPGRESCDTRFVRACTVEMHMDMSQEAFVRKFTGKMPDTSETTSIEHQALTVTVRTPQCGHAVWGMRRMWTDNHGG